MSIFFHMDLDAFFAAAEVLDDPSIAGKPVVVGATPGRRGVVSTCSYEARRFGIHSAMPISEAFRLCPQAVFKPVRMSRYAELSTRVLSIFACYTPELIRVSIDEASLDMSGTGRLWGPPPEAAAAIRDRVRDETGLSISTGVASNRYVAKIASGTMKPAGLVVVPAGGEADFMKTLRLKDLWGVGPKTRERLEELGVDTMERVLGLSAESLSSVFGKAGGDFIYKAARGMDPGMYSGEVKSRSVSTETTFEKDVVDFGLLEETLLGMAEELFARLYAERASSCCVALKVRYEDFETLSAQETRTAPFTGSGGVYEAARALLYRTWNGRPLRLIGLGLTGLRETRSAQGNLFEEPGDREARVEKAGIEAARRGFGKLTRARLVPRPTPKRPS
jgi:DNA polymerase-4